jgi:CheY-like chemotaxis protein
MATLRKEAIDARTVVERAVESVRPEIEQRRHELQVSLPPAPAVIEADAVRLEQILVNLLTNAAKFTDPGGRIDAALEQDEQSVTIRVRDTGVGIPVEMLDRIFEPFSHVDRTLASPSQWGLGIGLSIARSLTALHGGTVAAHSAGRGQGSEFVLRLPRSAPGANPPVDLSAPQDASAKRSLRVLAVDDNRDAADALAMMLDLQGHQARTACDGHSALQVAGAFKPDVVLLDLAMPGLDGYQVADLLRKQAQGAPPALIALTGFGQEEHLRRSKEAGFTNYLIKPVDPNVLAKMLDSLA